MSVLAALDRYYGRMAERGEVETVGWSRQKISYALVLSRAGEPVQVTDLREASGKKLVPRRVQVPAPVTRTVAVLPNRLWDKTAYAFGRTAGEGRRTALEHQAFRAAALELLEGQEDEGLIALRLFMERWRPERFDAPPFAPEMLDANFVFRLDGDMSGYLHQRPAAVRLLERSAGTERAGQICLVTGTEAPAARLHPSIRGVEGAQSSGAPLVSFNKPSFESYEKVQGDNAPTSEAAAFRYGEALNRMLDRGSPNRIARPIGDATTVFWADTSATVNEDAAKAAEQSFASWWDPPPVEDLDQDKAEAAKLRDALDLVADGRAEAADPRLKRGTRFHVLGLAPNSARLSIRIWVQEDFAVIARHLQQHHEDLRVEPLPWRAKPPSVARLLVKTTALQEKFANIPPLLAGEVMRAVLTGGRYPRTLLTTAVMRLRAGDDPATGWHAAAIHAVLARDHRLKLSKEPAPMSLNRENPDAAYQLGRLFAALEVAQRMALKGINATIRDRYFGAASATPAGVFPVLIRGAQNHLGKLRKSGKGGWIEREIEEISDHIVDRYPRSLRLEAQGRFFLGYYHQRRSQSAKPGVPATEETPAPDDTNGSEDNQ